VKFLPKNKDYEIDEETWFSFLDLKLYDSLGSLVYLTFANLDTSIEGYIDLSVIQSDLPNKTRKEIVSAFNKVVKCGLIEVLHSENWKHRKVIIHPIKKILTR
jgi:hypothetical protein